MGDAAAERTYREVMTVDPSAATTPLEQASREFVFGGSGAAGTVPARPSLGDADVRRARRTRRCPSRRTCMRR